MLGIRLLHGSLSRLVVSKGPSLKLASPILFFACPACPGDMRIWNFPVCAQANRVQARKYGLNIPCSEGFNSSRFAGEGRAGVLLRLAGYMDGFFSPCYCTTSSNVTGPFP